MSEATLAGARSFLFVPASRPERVPKALDSGADCVIVDLEDAVEPDGKVEARRRLAEMLPGLAAPQLARTLIRINPAETRWHEDDLELVSAWTARGGAGVMVPKAASTSALESIAKCLAPGAHLVPLIESLEGLDRLDAVAAAPRVARLALGHLDLQLDLGMRCGPEEEALGPVRFMLVAASRRAQLPPPIDGVTVDVRDGARLARDAQRAREFGFGGKLCIHPAQVQPLNEAFSPSIEELSWARRVVEGARVHDGRVFSLDGRMVDLPVIRLAQQTLRRAVRD